jgi:hypothetical protein
MTAVRDLPEVFPETVLHLRPGEWSGGRDGRPVIPSDIRVLKVHTDRAPADATEVWVTGHLLECGWESVEPHPPCCEVLVDAAAILRCLREATG